MLSQLFKNKQVMKQKGGTSVSDTVVVGFVVCALLVQQVAVADSDCLAPRAAGQRNSSPYTFDRRQFLRGDPVREPKLPMSAIKVPDWVNSAIDTRGAVLRFLTPERKQELTDDLVRFLFKYRHILPKAREFVKEVKGRGKQAPRRCKIISELLSDALADKCITGLDSRRTAIKKGALASATFVAIFKKIPLLGSLIKPADLDIKTTPMRFRTKLSRRKLRKWGMKSPVELAARILPFKDRSHPGEFWEEEADLMEMLAHEFIARCLELSGIGGEDPERYPWNHLEYFVEQYLFGQCYPLDGRVLIPTIEDEEFILGELDRFYQISAPENLERFQQDVEDRNGQPRNHKLKISIAPSGNCAEIFVSGTPSDPHEDFMNQFYSLFDEIEENIGAMDNVAHLVIFLKDNEVFMRDMTREDICCGLLKEYFSGSSPSITFVQQPPCDGSAIGVELWAKVPEEGSDLTIHRIDENMTVADHDGVQWTHIEGLTSDPRLHYAYEQAHDVFLQARDKFRKISLYNVPLKAPRLVRLWNLIGGILSPEDGKNRYTGYCDARREEFYDIFPKDGDGPYRAATGIGTNTRDCRLSIIGIASTRNDVGVYEIDNPRQIRPSKYKDTATVEQDTEAAKKLPRPLFERGTAVVTGEDVRLFVSGTASILNRKPQHVGDAAEQVRETMRNFMAVTENANNVLAGHGITTNLSEEDIAQLRVYVKNIEDYEEIKKALMEYLGDAYHHIPIIYVQADICYSDLLVEIEGVVAGKVQPESPIQPQSAPEVALAL